MENQLSDLYRRIETRKPNVVLFIYIFNIIYLLDRSNFICVITNIIHLTKEMIFLHKQIIKCKTDVNHYCQHFNCLIIPNWTKSDIYFGLLLVSY